MPRLSAMHLPFDIYILISKIRWNTSTSSNRATVQKDDSRPTEDVPTTREPISRDISEHNSFYELHTARAGRGYLFSVGNGGPHKGFLPFVIGSDTRAKAIGVPSVSTGNCARKRTHVEDGVIFCQSRFRQFVDMKKREKRRDNTDVNYLA